MLEAQRLEWSFGRGLERTLYWQQPHRIQKHRRPISNRRILLEEIPKLVTLMLGMGSLEIGNPQLVEILYYRPTALVRWAK